MTLSSSTSSSPGSPDFDSGRGTGANSREASTSASSPPANASSEYSRATSQVTETEELSDNDEVLEKAKKLAFDESETERRLARLQSVLQRSAVFSSILKDRMDEEKARQLAIQAERREQLEHMPRAGRPSKKKKGVHGEAIPVEDPKGKDEEPPVFMQPALITGAKLKPYQLEGLQWMVSLDQNGISGILADEMGLGKTLQTISFSAYLREHGNFKPFLVVCPLSVVHNWSDEYKKFAPDIPTCIYHGSPDERAELRRGVMAPPVPRRPRGRATASSSKNTKSRKTKAKPANKAKQPRKSTVVLDSEEEGKNEAPGYTASFPIVLTTYEMIIRDRAHLQHYDWGYIVVDEGHRLKNLNCKLMKEIKKYSSAGRMILTGTPLHNNLAELWSLLNFILPDIFDDLDTFQEWFNLPELQTAIPTSQSSQIIASLHAILKPFLLRRLKVDVEQNLPPKKEYVLYAPLSVRQREAYDCVLDGGIREWLIRGGAGGVHIVNDDDEVEMVEPQDGPVDASVSMEEGASSRPSKRLVTRGPKNYDVDGDDDEYFEMLEQGKLDRYGVKPVLTQEEMESAEAKIGRDHQVRTKVKQVNNMRLKNTIMQLRKVCSHPFLFDWPIDPETLQSVLGEELVNASGKMMVLDRLLKELFKRKHKVLLFSQFTTMLNIIEEWAVDYMGWNICRIDGSSKPMERREEMNRFQTGGDDPNAPNLFLISTRAGGLGINLVAADTVIFYDQDWNPQMDAQAQDRAHRIGQTKPVLIFRLVTAHTVETKIMQRATEKRKLEALVIAKGKFKTPAGAVVTKRETVAELAASLLRLEGEKIDVVPDTKEGKQNVLSDADLDVLLDRSPGVFMERGQGWTSGSAQGARDAATSPAAAADANGVKKAVFAVYQAPVEEGNDALAKMLGEEEAE
ncbi:hypothetical protein HYPSUDRAFT_171034 [Hypholoma sublateritium FD-334 SS-4]|uniref:Uncharacterized protein n=1 Tax=Hypholoma sublateritium (strain FD-334 SS-4) TaxID=945553 RepID=A0A0D2P8T8_HYPSF|nr:hypothetical protein HYPSUDRAFT_171034 [Hypholoma sublateritium FD-334 SS-4]